MSRKFWIVALIAFINSLSFTIIIPVIYLYGKEFGLTDFQTSLLLAIYSIAQFIATPIFGKLSDVFGRKPLLIISLAGTVGANLLAGFATTAWLLFLARFLDGITGGNNSVAQAVVSDLTDPTTRARGFGFFGAAFGLGFILGPVVSLAAQEISLGAAFVVSSFMALIALVVTVLFLSETLPQKSTRMPNLFDFGLKELVQGFTIPRVGILLLINFMIGTTFTIFTFAFQPYYIYILDQDNQSLTQLFIVFGLLGVIMQTQGVTWLTKNLNLATIFFISLFVRSLSFCLMPVYPSISYFVAVSVAFSIFNSLVQPIVNTLISLNAKAEQQGIVMGLNSSYLSMSNAIGPIIAGLMINQSNPATYGNSLYLAGALTFLVLLFAMITRKRFVQQKPA